jgi:hypothetical protein
VFRSVVPLFDRLSGHLDGRIGAVNGQISARHAQPHETITLES